MKNNEHRIGEEGYENIPVFLVFFLSKHFANAITLHIFLIKIQRNYGMIIE